MKNTLIAATLLGLLGMLNSHFTADAQPVVTTLAATGVTTNGATLHGTVNPNGAATTVYFQYGLTANYGYLGAFTLMPATNTTQTLPGFVAAIPGAAGENWTQTDNGSQQWNAIASSADGTRLAAVAHSAGAFNGSIWTSSNSGATWTQTGAPGTNWVSIASSFDGTQLAAVVNGGGIYTSTNSGGTWTKSSAPSTSWSSIASSADGTQFAAVVNGGGIYTSTNSGGIWTQSSTPSTSWYSIASSADGSRLAAVVNGGGIYTSTNSGGTWTQSSAPASAYWSSIASSADGSRLAAAESFGGIWTSSNGGVSWTVAGAPAGSWSAIASSADGTRLAAVLYNAGIWTSSNGGVSFTLTSAPNPDNWVSIASSADGTQLAVLALGGGIYVSVGTASSLLSGATYHYRLVGINRAGTSLGSDLTFTTSAIAPFVSTLPASGIAVTNATLNGTVNPNGAVTTNYFQYGLTTNYGSFSATNNLPATNTTFSVSSPISSLAQDTTYHFRLVAVNAMGVTNGADASFTTAVVAPTVTIAAASGITTTNATLGGTVNPNGVTATEYFRYGLTTNYGSYSATNNLAATNTTLSISNLIGSLAPGTLYHFQSVAVNSGNTIVSADMSFTTAQGLPTVTTLRVSNITTTNATLNGVVLTGGLNTLAYFQYGLTTSYGSYSGTTNLTATNTTLSVSNLTASLSPGTYHYQLVASNSAGIGVGADLTFATTPFAPTVTTLPASGVTPTSATLNGTVNPGYGPTTAYFQYGLTTNYGDFGGFAVLPAVGTTLTMTGPAVSLITAPAGSNWTQTANGSQQWNSIAASADGTRLAAVARSAGALNGSIWTSTNSGATWTQTGAPSTSWSSIASSADGTQLAAVANGGGIYTSTNSGGTWTQSSAPSAGWSSIASSADGTQLGAVVSGGGIWTSTDSGATWTQSSAPSASWSSIASSTAGTGLAAVVNGGGIYVSTNSGGTWTQSSAPSTYWFSIASSADGSRLAAAILGGGIYTSTNSGSTWTLTSAPSAGWTAIASSADGTRLAAVVYAGGIYTSTNSGAAWTLTSAPSPDNWSSIASSADGTRLAVVAVGGGIYVSAGTVSSLAPGTTYHYRLVGINGAGTALGADLTFATPVVSAPAVTTLAASGITATSATLNGTVNPNGGATTAWFQYGLTTSYGSFTTTTNLAATYTTFSLSNLIGSLAPGTTYHFQIVASNSVSTTLGADLTFTTGPAAPTVATLAATGADATSATLNGTVNPNGAATTAWFKYGLTTSYGNSTTTTNLAPTNTTLSVPSLIGSLAPDTTYHFQIVASNSVSTILGTDLTFTTGAAAPKGRTLAATSVNFSSATLNATVNPNGAATTAYFRYSTNSLSGGVISNPSFEADTYTVVPGYASDNGGTITGWTLSNPTRIGLNPANGTMLFANNGAIPDGANVAFIQSSNDTNTLSTTLSNLVVGTTYTVSFRANSRSGFGGAPNATWSLNGGPFVPFTASPPVGGANPYYTNSGSFTATASTAVLALQNSTPTDSTVLLDDFSVSTTYATSSLANLPATNSNLAVSIPVSGLQPTTTYHFQIVASNSLGTALGADLTFTTASTAAPNLNGTVNPDFYGSPLTVQSINTGFGNSAGNNDSAGGSELDAAYGKISGGNLYLFLAGNFEANGNHLNVFIAGGAAGQTTLALPATATMAAMNGSAFSPGFQTTFAFDMNVYSATPGTVPGFLYSEEYTNNGPGTLNGGYVGALAEGSLGIAAGSDFGVSHLYLNNNHASTMGAANTALSGATSGTNTTTGLELVIPLSVIGYTGGNINVLAAINGGSDGYLSNQFLPGLPVGTANLGTATFNFGSTPNQFFTVQPGGQRPVSPTLYISNSGSTVTVSWQALSGWSLQQNADLNTPTGWSTNSSWTTSNGTNYLNLTSPTGNMFFRLSNP
jgi:hypothetical protein